MRTKEYISPRQRYQDGLLAAGLSRAVIDRKMAGFDILATPEDREWYANLDVPGWHQFPLSQIIFRAGEAQKEKLVRRLKVHFGINRLDTWSKEAVAATEDYLASRRVVTALPSGRGPHQRQVQFVV